MLWKLFIELFKFCPKFVHEIAPKIAPINASIIAFKIAHKLTQKFEVNKVIWEFYDFSNKRVAFNKRVG